MLHSNLFDSLLTWCNEAGYHIIVDSPALETGTDSMILAPLSDSVILVVGTGKTRRSDVLRTKNMLSDSGGNLLGVIMNGYRRHLPKKLHRLCDR